MTYFFTFLLQAILPFGLLTTCLWSNSEKVKFKAILWLSLLGLATGVAVVQLLPNTQTIIFFRTNVMLGILLAVLACQLFGFSKLQLLWQFLLFVIAGIQWGKDPNLTAITQTDVVNTELLLNITAIVIGLFVVLFTACLLFILFKQADFNTLKTRLFGFVFLIIIIPLAGDLVLSMMKLQVIGVEKIIVSFVAKSTLVTQYSNYLLFGVLQAVIFYLFFTKVYLPCKQAVNNEIEPTEKRKKIAQLRTARRILLWGGLVSFMILSSQLYWDRVASQPPKLSAAAEVKLSADGKVHLPIAPFKDNKLHRFIWHSESGKSVRFFIINRLADKFSLGVVFDACLLCGDQGYVMQGNQVVCIGCGVYMFTPSIGKAGGCNPVPIENWQQTNNEVIISRESLEAGLPLFSTNYKEE